MKYLLMILLAVSMTSYAAEEKKQDTEPIVEIPVRDIMILMKLAEDQKKIIENLQDQLYDTKKDLEELEDKCTF